MGTADQQRTAVPRTVIWQGLWRPGAEWCELQRARAGWSLAGTALVAVDGVPWQVRYAIALDDAWATREVQIAALPINRLAPAGGESVGVTAVWVRFPELTIEPLPQRYTRLAERHYRYASHEGAFVAGITVDDLGLVISYEGLWQRIAETE